METEVRDTTAAGQVHNFTTRTSHHGRSTMSGADYNDNDGGQIELEVEVPEQLEPSDEARRARANSATRLINVSGVRPEKNKVS
jgi:hypothetical protein